jgi:hypothetical protein
MLVDKKQVISVLVKVVTIYLDWRVSCCGTHHVNAVRVI